MTLELGARQEKVGSGKVGYAQQGSQQLETTPMLKTRDGEDERRRGEGGEEDGGSCTE